MEINNKSIGISASKVHAVNTKSLLTLTLTLYCFQLTKDTEPDDV